MASISSGRVRIACRTGQAAGRASLLRDCCDPSGQARTLRPCVKLEPYLYRFCQMSSLIATLGIGDEIYSVPGGRLAGQI
ncbi:hypothetical protein CN134_28405 [Sinorhizobium meliloti]|nr:hypothetical protein CN134_28405 [Sinorhizobium meliloti]RVO21828.1 hypothetical protein CN098_32675 [Sinorhizobium meliloti]